MTMTSRTATILALVATLAVAVAAPAGAVDLQYSWGHPSPQGNAVFGLAFADAQNGWAVCGGGTILRTTDAGEHWQEQHGLLSVATDLYDIVVTPAGTLVAVGDGIHRSTDGGATWSAIAAPGSSDLRDLALIPGGDLSAAGDGGVTLVSTDDGLTWGDVGPHVGTIKHHVWLSTTEAYVVGDDVAHHTTDGGAHWTQFLTFAFFGYSEVYFTTPTVGYVVEDFAYWVTTNGGLTWTQNSQFVAPLYRYRTLVLTPQHWLAVCDGEGAELWETVDGGTSWTNHLFRPLVGCPSIVQTPAGRVVFGSSGGDLYWTDDFGATLTNTTTNLCEAAVNAYILTFMLRPDGVLFAANQPSSGGDVQSWLRSDDGGTTWSVPASAPGLRWVYGADFLDNDHGVVVFDSEVRYTDDGGDTWNPATLPDANRGVRVTLAAPDRYFIAAYKTAGGGALLLSDDGGQSWIPVGGGLPANGVRYSDVAFPTPQIGFAAGNTNAAAPVLYRTSDAGATWQSVTATGLTAPISTMVWFDAQTAVAAARNGSNVGVFRTVDGGEHWTNVLATTIASLAFQPDGRGLAAPLSFSSQSYYSTEDWGQTWQPVTAPLSSPFPGYHYSPSVAVAVGDHWVIGGNTNRLLVVRDQVTTATPDGVVAAAGPGVCAVTAVSPNPFNPRTTLAYSVARDGHVQLAIFDLRGRRVRALVDGARAAGRHVAAWDGRDDRGAMAPAGVYLYRLESGGQTATGKLVMMK